MYNYCSVPNCDSKREYVKLHVFPCNDNRLAKWLDCVNSESLRALSADELKKRYVCQKHFEKRFVTSKFRILGSAYPSLFTDDEISSGLQFIHYEDTENRPSDHTYGRKRHHDHNYVMEKSKSLEITQQDVNQSGETVDDDTAMEVPNDTISESCDERDDEFSWKKREVIPVLTDEVVIEEPVLESICGEDIELYNQCETTQKALLGTICEEATELYEQCESTQEAQLKPDTEHVLHDGFQCNVCGAGIQGFRYVCVQCTDFDLCDACEGRGEHALHYVLRVPEARPYNEIQMVLRSIRRELDVIVQRSQNALDETVPNDVKSEIKEEQLDPLDESPSLVPDDEQTLYDETLQPDDVCSATCLDDTLPGECRVAVDETTSARMKQTGEERRAPTHASHSRGRLRKRKHVDVGENQSETEDFSEFEDDDYSHDDDSDGSSDSSSRLDHSDVGRPKNSDIETLSCVGKKLLKRSDETKIENSDQCQTLYYFEYFDQDQSVEFEQFI